MSTSMYEGKRVLALIPARGGSKGLPGKNIRSLAGKPLIAWSIEAARGCPAVDAVVVSTDSAEIEAAAKRYGADAPFLRPPELSTDTASTVDALLHGLAWLEEQGRRFDLLLLLQPTSPLRTSRDIEQALALYRERNALAVVSVCPVEHSPMWMNTLPDDGCMKAFLNKETLNRPRQQLPEYYRLNGAVYLADIPWFRREKSFFGPRTYALVMPRERSVDIDDLLDFSLAELLFSRS